MAEHFRADGRRASRTAPEWVRVRCSLTYSFPTYYDTQFDQFAQQAGRAIEMVNDLRPKRDGPVFLGEDPSFPDYHEVTSAFLPDVGEPIDEVLEDSIQLFDGMLNVSHPLSMPNVIPPPNKAAILASMITNVMSPNIVEGEFAWNLQKAEMESAAIVARLLGWDPTVAGGFYTYGGSGCFLYGVKYALTEVLGTDTRYTGIRTDGKILMSQQGHYAKMNATDWTGLGMHNIIDLNTDDETNSMDLKDLERKLQYYTAEGTPVIAVICTMGTTDAFAVDPVDKVRSLVDKYPNKAPYGRALIYCDAVIGWSFLTFGNYDFDRNHLGFTDRAVAKLRRNYRQMSMMRFADAVGTDFHKTGWAPYNCSLFMMKDLNHFRSLMTRPGSAYLQERTPNNPGLYTLEVSRSGSHPMAGWATLKHFGYRGFQALLGGTIEIGLHLRDKLEEEKSLVCVNKDDHGFVTLFRVYPEDVEAEIQYEHEVSDIRYQKDLIKYNKFQELVADILFEWMRSGEKISGYYGPYTTYTSGFRTTDYSDDLSDGSSVVYALKSFPMSINTTSKTMEDLVDMVKIARDRAVSGYTPKLPDPMSIIGPPYNIPNPSVSYRGEPNGENKKVRSLMSGVFTVVNSRKDPVLTKN